jgi:signal transduction histidine kinase
MGCVVGLFLRRWLFLVLGGVLGVPYAVLAGVVVPLSIRGLASMGGGVFLAVTVTVGVATIVVTAWLPVVRVVEGALVPALLGGPATGLVVAPARTWVARWRLSGWFALHTTVGGLCAFLSAITLPVLVPLLVSWWGGAPGIPVLDRTIPVGHAWAPLVAAGWVVALLALVWAFGAVAAWLAPRVLGPDAATRIAELERRTAHLAERHRLARELHDSIGHALTVTTLQASAARTVLHTDPDFAERALDAIADTGRRAGAELDDFLGLLRERPQARAPQTTLADLGLLVATHRDTGLPIVLTTTGDLGRVPGVVSREVYRIVQEGLTNVRRHAGEVPTTVQVSVDGEELTAVVHNDAPAKAAGRRTRSGGLGLSGARERVRPLGGEFRAGPCGTGWRMRVSVPIGAGR